MADGRTLVFAGNLEQARNWAQFNHLRPKEWRYVSRPDGLRGCRTKGQPRVFIGTFYQRSDAPRFLEGLAYTDLLGADRD